MDAALHRGPTAAARHTGAAVHEDVELLRRLAAGERAAMEALHARHAEAVLAYVRHLTRDPAMAEEVLQETLVAAWRGAARFRGGSSIRVWLIGIARRQALKAVSRRSRGDPCVGAAERAPALDPGPEAAAVAAAERRELAEALLRLPVMHREVLVLTFVHGLSHPEAAAVIGVPVGTVKSRLFHAKRALRLALDRRPGET